MADEQSTGEHRSEVVLYKTDDGEARLDVVFQDDTVWLTQDQMSALFAKAKSTINEHIKNIYQEGELSAKETMRKFGKPEFKAKPTNFYNLDVIIAVGYRVKSSRGTQFRVWATQRLREYIIKGFALDDERMKEGGGRARYFQELLQRIRDIRSSERNFYQKITDIYATSIDYRVDARMTKEFFATVQNKMHYAVHGHTAAELISQRADNTKPLMGLTSFRGDYVTAQDARTAKNYLTEPELHQLNLVVSLYLDFAELQASNNRPMRMVDWIEKLDQFLLVSDKQVLHNAGTVSADAAARKAAAEFEKFSARRMKGYVSDFDRAVRKIESRTKRVRKPGA